MNTIKDKGFTLVELLAAITILGILMFIGVVAITNVFDNTKDNYYKSMENTLGIAGNEYFNDNRDDKPIDDYNFVDIKTLEEHNYIEELKTYDGKESCDPSSGVYIYNTDSGNGYEVCLICGDYKPKDGTYCGGTKYGTINLSGNINSPDGPYYNPLLSYSGTSWINAGSIYIHFSYKSEGEQLNNYKMYNANTNTFFSDCNASQYGTCMLKMDTTGSYYVEGYNGSKKVANKKYFNIKLDNTDPSFAIKNTETEFLLENDEILYTYENEIINVNDDNGYKEVTYTLTRYNPTKDDNIEYIAKDEDLISKDLKISHPLSSGKYDLYIYVKDFAGNEGKCTNSNTHITFYIRYKVNLEYFDNKDKKHDAGTIKVYTYGNYDNLPETVNVNGNSKETSWYRNTNFVAPIITKQTRVDKTGHHTLYGKEGRNKATFHATCNNNIIYNGQNQTLATIPANEQGKYRLVVYYNGSLMANEAKDARTYMVIAILNSDYMWSDGTRTAKSINCEIRPKQVPKPSCANTTYNGGEQKIVTTVDNSGVYYGFNGEKAYSLDKRPFGVNAGTYYFSTSFNGLNYAWANVGDHIYDSVNLTCTIQKKKLNISRSTLRCNDPKELEFAGHGYAMTLLSSGSIWSTPSSNEVVNVEGSTYDQGDTEYYVFYAEERQGFPPSTSSQGMSIPANIEPLYSMDPIKGSKVGTYNVKLHLESNNYTWADGSTGDISIQCTITPAKVEVKWDNVTEYVYDGKKHPPVPTIDLTSYGDTMVLKTTQESAIGSYTSTVSCVSSTYGCESYNIQNPTKKYKIVDKTVPTCKLTLSASDVNYKASDNHAIRSFVITGAGTSVQSGDGNCKSTNIYGNSNFTSPGKVVGTVTDCSGNVGTCTLTIKRQKTTATCKTYSYTNQCSAYGSYQGCNYYSDISNGTTISCRFCGNGQKYECKYRTCYNVKTGCSEWNDWGNWTDTDSCTEGVATDFSYKTQCRYTS